MVNEMNWFENEKNKFYKKEKKSLFSSKPKRMKSKKSDEFSPERVMKLTGGLVLTAGGILAGTKLIQAIGDA